MIPDVRLFRRGKIYYVEIRRGLVRSLKTTSQDEANKICQQIRREILAGRLADISGQSRHTLGGFYDALDEMGPLDKSKGSFDNDLAAIRKLIKFAGRTVRLDRVSLKHVHSMTAEMQRQGLKPNTINLHIRHARAALNRAVEWGWVRTNPIKDAAQVPVPKKPPRFMDVVQAWRFLAGIRDVEKRRFAAAAISTGRRIGELIALRWDDVDLARGVYTAKNKRAHLTRTYPITTLFRSTLNAIGPQDIGRVWPRWNDRRNVSRWIKAELIKAGHPTLTAHSLRHSYASMLALEGRSLKTIKELLGHTQISTTMIYAHLTEDHLAKEAEIRFGPVDLIGSKD